MIIILAQESNIMIDNVLIRFVNAILKYLKQPLKEKRTETLVQFLKFCFVGFTNVFISYLFYLLFYFFFCKLGIYGKVNFLTSQIIGFIVSIFWSFYCNKKYVFISHYTERRSVITAFFKMFLSYSVTGIALNCVLLVLWIEIFNIPAVIAPLLNVFLCIPVNFLLNKYWAFNK